MGMSKLDAEVYQCIGAPEYVIQWIKEGVKLPFIKEPNHCFYSNRVSGKKQSFFMDEQISKLLKTGAVKLVNYKPRCILAMQCVPKKGGKLQLIMDCHPINVNMQTPKFS